METKSCFATTTDKPNPECVLKAIKVVFLTLYLGIELHLLMAMKFSLVCVNFQFYTHWDLGERKGFVRSQFAEPINRRGKMQSKSWKPRGDWIFRFLA